MQQVQQTYHQHHVLAQTYVLTQTDVKMLLVQTTCTAGTSVVIAAGLISSQASPTASWLGIGLRECHMVSMHRCKLYWLAR